MSGKQKIILQRYVLLMSSQIFQLWKNKQRITYFSGTSSKVYWPCEKLS